MPAPPYPEIDHKTLKLIVGVVALLLATLTNFFASSPLESISASYYETGLSHVIFIGFLSAMSAFLIAYNGYTQWQMIFSKVAAVTTLCVALFPCGCASLPVSCVMIVPSVCKWNLVKIQHVHFTSAAVTFSILALFCYVFFQRALIKGTAQAKSRAYIYAICGVVIVGAIVVLGVDHLIICLGISRLTFYGETTALIAFGVSWLTASHYLPFITTKDERLARAKRLSSACTDPTEKTASPMGYFVDRDAQRAARR